jgi:hypothetical protein
VVAIWMKVKSFGLHRYTIGLASLLISIGLYEFSKWSFISDSDFRSRVSLMLCGAALSIAITLTIVDVVIKADRRQQWEKVKSLTYEEIIDDLIDLALFLPSSIGSRWMCFNYEVDISKATDKGIAASGKEVSDVIIKMAKAMKNEVNPRDLPLEKSTIKEIRTEYDILKWHIYEMRIILIPRVLQLSEDQEVNAALLRFEKDVRIFENRLFFYELEIKKTLLDAETIIDLLEAVGNLYEIIGRKYSNP